MSGDLTRRGFVGGTVGVGFIDNCSTLAITAQARRKETEKAFA